MSRWENAPTTRELVRMMDVMVDLRWCQIFGQGVKLIPT
jgi:hypothetical protein